VGISNEAYTMMATEMATAITGHKRHDKP